MAPIRCFVFILATICVLSVESPLAAGTTCIVTDPTGTPLNVRTSPNGTILRGLSNGTAVKIKGQTSLNGKPWALIASASGQSLGWVFRSFVTCSAAVQIARPEPREPKPRPIIVERIVREPPRTPSAGPKHEARQRGPETQMVTSQRDPLPIRDAPIEPSSAIALPVQQSNPRQEAAPSPIVQPVLAPPTPQAVLDTSIRPQRIEKRVALVIGNSDYKYAPLIPNPVHDAHDTAEALRKLGFEVVEGQNLDFQGTRSSIREFSQRTNNADLVLFFYAGHGVQVSGKNYLIPVDAQLNVAADLDIDAISLEAVIKTMEAQPHTNIIMLDACRDNPFTRSLRRSISASRAVSVGQGLAPIQTTGGTLVAFATDPDNVALDGNGARNSPFTESLLKHIGTPNLEIETVLKRVRRDVIDTTKGKQTPWSSSSLTQEIYLANNGRIP